MAKIISFCNHKGGVGKTTSAVNIARGISEDIKRVLLLDLDPQANATQAVGLDPYTVEHNIYGVLRGKYELSDAICVSKNEPNIAIVPACLDLVAAESQLINELGRERIVESLLASVRDDYDYILIDCPPSLGILTINALTASNAVLIPVQPHFFAVQGLQQLLDVIERIKRSLNLFLHVGGVFATDYDSRVKMHRDALSAIEQAFPKELFKTQIRHNVALSEAAARGVSIFTYDPRSNGAADYGALSREIIERFETDADSELVKIQAIQTIQKAQKTRKNGKK